MFQRGATTFSENDWVTPPALAVRLAVWSVETAATVAVKAALTAPAATVTVAGTVTFELLLARETANPPVRAGALNPTLQAAVPGALTLAGAQETPVKTGTVSKDMVPPVPDAEVVLPEASAALTAVIATGTEALRVPGAMLNVTVANVPSPMTVLFIPKATQIVLPLVLVQDTLLPAAVALLPAVALTPAMSAGE
jgi:hypothetical protein